MIVECVNQNGERRGVETDPQSRGYGWVYYKHPDGQWVTLRKATDDEIARAIAGGEMSETNTPRTVDEIVTALYRRFKAWSARGFGAEDVTWCEVKADVIEIIDSAALRDLAAAREELAQERERAERAEEERDAALAWTDEDQEIAEEREIEAAHPTQAGTHAQWNEAMRMVGAKRSKGALVRLVCWLLVRAERAEARAEAAEKDAGRWRACLDSVGVAVSIFNLDPAGWRYPEGDHLIAAIDNIIEGNDGAWMVPIDTGGPPIRAPFELKAQSRESIEARFYRYLRDEAGQYAEDTDGPMICAGLGDQFDYLRGEECDEAIRKAIDTRAAIAEGKK